MTRRPNFLLTVADDQRHSALSCCEGPTADAVRTPRLDALAERGCRFTHAYHAGSFSGAVCMPSRAMLHSGCERYAVPEAMGGAEPGCPPLLGELLQQQGYHTHGVGKWHNNEAPFTRNFTTGDAVFFGGMCDMWNVPTHRWDAEQVRGGGVTLNCHATEVFTEAGVEFLQCYARGDFGDAPFFLYVAYTAPHDPRQTHRHYHDRYPLDAVPLPPNFQSQPAYDLQQSRMRDEMLAPMPRPEAVVRQQISDYYAMIEHLDHALGRLHQVLADLGLADDTLVAHTADHGLAVGQHGLMGKQSMFDHSIRVPLIAAGPNVTPGHVADEPVYQHDLYPTLLEAAGVDRPEHTPYRSLSTMLGGGRGGHEHIASYFGDTQRVATDGRHKLIRYDAPLDEQMHWFDLEADPWERSPSILGPDRLTPPQAALREALPAQR